MSDLNPFDGNHREQGAEERPEQVPRCRWVELGSVHSISCHLKRKSRNILFSLSGRAGIPRTETLERPDLAHRAQSHHKGESRVTEHLKRYTLWMLGYLTLCNEPSLSYGA